MVRAILVAAGLCLAAIAGADMQESVKQSKAYVDSLDDRCVYDHGYRCLAAPADDASVAESDRLMVPGRYLEAWSVSYRDFLDIAEMTDEQKRLRHYKIGFGENDDQFVIVYQGLLLPRLDSGEVVGTLRATYGISTQYWIDSRTMQIDRRLFLR